MIDPFLAAHLVAPRVFELGGGRSPVSIRDQILRGELLVERCVESGQLRSDTQLLVIGAGAAGVAAAMAAAARNIPVLLADSSPSPFALQRGCVTRWIDPTLYDWPVSHWSKASYHWRPPPAILSYRAGTPDQIVRYRDAQFQSARRTHAQFLTYSPETDIAFVRRLVSPAGMIQMLLTDIKSGQSVRRSFDVVFVCVGFGPETVSVGGHYAGFRFWENDALNTPGAGTANARPRILVSGGGDGALQDVLRCLTVHNNVRGIIDVLEGDPFIRQHLHEALREIHSVEDQLIRTLAWVHTGDHEHRAFLDNQLSVRLVVDTLVGGCGSALDRAIRATLRSHSVVLSHACEHFGKVYALNRFLVLLYERLGHVTILPNQQIESVTPVDPPSHQCGNPWRCLGYPHNVSIVDKQHCTAMVIGGLHSLGSFDAVVIRHGSPAAPFPFSGFVRDRQRAKQVLPYHLCPP